MPHHHPSIHLNVCSSLPSPGAPIQPPKFHNLQIVRTYTHTGKPSHYRPVHRYPDAAALALANIVWAKPKNLQNKTKYYYAIRDATCVHIFIIMLYISTYPLPVFLEEFQLRIYE